AHYDWNLSDAKILEGSGEGPYKMLYQRYGWKQITLTVKNENCIVSDTQDILVRRGPWAYFQLKDDACINEPTEVVPYKEEAAYAWSFDGAAIHDTTKYGTYHISWSSTGHKNVLMELTAANGCVSRYYQQVMVHDKPEPKIESVSTTNICTGDVIKLAALQIADQKNKWQPRKYFYNDSSIEALAKVPATGNIYLSATDTWGCVGFDSVWINTKPCCDVTLPDAFTPNGDGHNDKF